jgi:hypothetical protein
MLVSVMVLVAPSSLVDMRSEAARVSASRAPPAKQMVTHVPHPATSTFSASPTRSLISSNGFCSAMIIGSPSCALGAVDAKWVGTHLRNPLGHLGGGGGELGRHGGRHVEHLDPLGLQAYLGEQVLRACDPLPGLHITFQVMAITGQSPGRHDAVHALLEGEEHGQHVDAAGARDLDHFHR